MIPIRKNTAPRLHNYKLVRRGDKWALRVKFKMSLHDDEIFSRSGAYKITSPSGSDSNYMKESKHWDYNFWFKSKQEALMFILRCI